MMQKSVKLLNNKYIKINKNMMIKYMLKFMSIKSWLILFVVCLVLFVVAKTVIGFLFSWKLLLLLCLGYLGYRVVVGGWKKIF